LHGFDSVAWKKAKDKGEIANSNNEYIKYDLEVITADFLIDNIENSFYAWENFVWCKDMDFNIFKHQILPYRVDKEPLMNLREHFLDRFSWLVDSMENNNDMKRAFELVYNKFYHFTDKHRGWGYGNVQNLYDVVRLSEGLCYHTTLLKTHITRSLGIICLFDETPHWANRSSSHSWNAFVNRDGVLMTMSDNKVLEEQEFIPSARFNIMNPRDSLLPEELLVYPIKKVAKVYRKSFTVNPRSVFYSNFNKNQISSSIDDLYQIDVTEDYLECNDVKIQSSNRYDDQPAYICVIDRGNIIPVDWGIIQNGEVVFNSIGNDILYLAVLITDDQYHPLSYPFILKKDGSIRYIKCNDEEKESIRLFRKYPLFGNILNYANQLYKGRFQGSNKEDFSDASDLFIINKTFLLPVEFVIEDNNEYRYLRYLPDTITNGDIGNISFYYDSGRVQKEVSGEYIFKFEGQLDRHVSKAFDGDPATFYSSNEKGTWIGLDLGEGNEKKITKIRFNPRTDTNYIIPGKDYELFYWDEGWKSLGRKVASGMHMDYKYVPADALFWLHCHSGGKEERPFTIEDGVQVWW